MGRSRNIKPSFFLNDELAQCSAYARLVFIGLWTLADREGRLIYNPKKIKASIMPYDDCDIENCVSELLNCTRDGNILTLYEVEGKKYLFINKFLEHQNPHVREKASTIPALTLASPRSPDSLLLIPDSSFLIPDSLSPANPTLSGTGVVEGFDSESFKPRDLSELPAERATTSGANDEKSFAVGTPTDKLPSVGVRPKRAKVSSTVEAEKVAGELEGVRPKRTTGTRQKRAMSLVQQALFDRFWAAYPKRRSRGEAEKAWLAIEPNEQLVETMVSTIERATTSVQWTKDAGQFIPYPATWLRARGWEDEETAAAIQDPFALVREKYAQP